MNQAIDLSSLFFVQILKKSMLKEQEMAYDETIVFVAFEHNLLNNENV
ncbi:hypothetical protein [Bacillus sp. FJAT-28004]|nr:hypothetical protein [Bacillus sp. FJAT-28004]